MTLNRRDMLAHLLARRDQTEAEVRQMIRDVSDFNRLHLEQAPLTVDDEHGSLAAACRSVGLDLAQLEREEGGGQGEGHET